MIEVNAELVKGYFGELVTILEEMELQKIRLKEVIDTVKESGINAGALKKAAQLHVASKYEETVEANEEVKSLYELATDYNS